MSVIVPSLKAMLTCDNIITEQGTGKKSLIGIFEKIYSSDFPCIHHSLSVYVNFTDALGKYNFRLELYDVEKEQVLARAELRDVSIPEKLGTGELAFNLRGLGFSHPGKYEFRIFANDRLFGIKSFFVEKVEVRGPQGPPGVCCLKIF